MCFLRKRFIQFLLALFLSKVLPGIVTIFMEWLKTLHSIICFPSRLPHVPNILSNVCGYGYWYTWICTGLSDIYTARATIKNMGQQMSGPDKSNGYSALIRRLGVRFPLRSRLFLSEKLWHFHKNIRSCVENECCCPLTVNIWNVNFTWQIYKNDGWLDT